MKKNMKRLGLRNETIRELCHRSLVNAAGGRIRESVNTCPPTTACTDGGDSTNICIATEFTCYAC